MNKLIEKKYLLALVAGLMMSFSFASHATEDDFVTSVKVRYASNDVNDSQGQELLYRKLKQAAHQVCGSTDIKVAGSALRVTRNRLCAEGALNIAVKRTGIKGVSELHVSQR